MRDLGLSPFPRVVPSEMATAHSVSIAGVDSGPCDHVIHRQTVGKFRARSSRFRSSRWHCTGTTSTLRRQPAKHLPTHQPRNQPRHPQRSARVEIERSSVPAGSARHRYHRLRARPSPNLVATSSFSRVLQSGPSAALSSPASAACARPSPSSQHSTPTFSTKPHSPGGFCG